MIKIVTKTGAKIVLEIERADIEKNGFDHVWDDLRSKYPEDSYELFHIDNNLDKKGLFIELVSKKINKIDLL